MGQEGYNSGVTFKYSNNNNYNTNNNYNNNKYNNNYNNNNNYNGGYEYQTSSTNFGTVQNGASSSGSSFNGYVIPVRSFQSEENNAFNIDYNSKPGGFSDYNNNYQVSPTFSSSQNNYGPDSYSASTDIYSVQPSNKFSSYVVTATTYGGKKPDSFGDTEITFSNFENNYNNGNIFGKPTTFSSIPTVENNANVYGSTNFQSTDPDPYLTNNNFFGGPKNFQSNEFTNTASFNVPSDYYSNTFSSYSGSAPSVGLGNENKISYPTFSSYSTGSNYNLNYGANVQPDFSENGGRNAQIDFNYGNNYAPSPNSYENSGFVTANVNGPSYNVNSGPSNYGSAIMQNSYGTSSNSSYEIQYGTNGYGGSSVQNANVYNTWDKDYTNDYSGYPVSGFAQTDSIGGFSALNDKIGNYPSSSGSKNFVNFYVSNSYGKKMRA